MKQKIWSNEVWTLLKNVFFIFTVFFLVRLYLIVNQSFAANISIDYLTAISLISYTAILFMVTGNAFGQSMLLLLNKETDQEAKDRIFNGAFSTTAGLSLIFGSLFLIFSHSLVHYLGIYKIPGVLTHCRVAILASMLLATNLVMKFTLLSCGRGRFAALTDVWGNLLNVLGCWMAVTLIDRPKDKFIGIAVTILLIQMGQFGVYSYSFRRSLKIRLNSLKSFLRRGSALIGSEASLSLLINTEPLLYSLLLQTSTSQEIVAAYNVGYRLYMLFSQIIVGLSYGGIIWLSMTWDIRNTKIWEQKTNIIFWISLGLAGIPISIAIGLLPYCGELLFKLKTFESQVMVAGILFSLLPLVFTTHHVCQIRIFEQPKFLAISQLLSVYGFGLPLTYWFAKNGSSLQIVLYGILVPSLVRTFSLFLYQKQFSRLRRTGLRIHLPRHWEPQVHIDSLNNKATNFNMELTDLGSRGCGIIITASERRLFSNGDYIMVRIYLGHRELFKAPGTIRHITPLKKKLFRRHKLVQIGVEFTNLEKTLETQIDMVIFELKAA